MDDAVVLDPGHCQVETWAARPPDVAGTALHVGPGCRVGPVELGVNADRLPLEGGDTAGLAGPQIKWVVDPIAHRLSIGMAWILAADLRHGGRWGQTGYAVATWWPSETLQVHGNAGADWAPGTGDRTRRLGLGIEWAANDTVSVLAERLVATSQWRSRVGTRINLTDLLSLDLSVSRADNHGVRGFAIGLNRDLPR
ncbi:MAG: hypothetical protein JSR59_27310 [Proteobacteria bacterium]|nr:hypothetical protein [Pseudomonadota bacterium]